MADDIVAGTSGDVTAADFNTDLDAWSATFDVGTTQYRTFSSKWLKQKNTGYSLSGQFSGTIQFNDASTQPVPDDGGDVNADAFEGVSFTLTAENGCTYSFTGNITGVNLNRPANDRMTGTFNFESDGEVQTTWDEST